MQIALFFFRFGVFFLSVYSSINRYNRLFNYIKYGFYIASSMHLCVASTIWREKKWAWCTHTNTADTAIANKNSEYDARAFAHAVFLLNTIIIMFINFTDSRLMWPGQPQTTHNQPIIIFFVRVQNEKPMQLLRLASAMLCIWWIGPRIRVVNVQFSIKHNQNKYYWSIWCIDDHDQKLSSTACSVQNEWFIIHSKLMSFGIFFPISVRSVSSYWHLHFPSFTI